MIKLKTYLWNSKLLEITFKGTSRKSGHMLWHHLQLEHKNSNYNRSVSKISPLPIKQMVEGEICHCSYYPQFNKLNFQTNCHLIGAWNLTSVSNRTAVYKTYLGRRTVINWCIITLKLWVISQIWLLAKISSILNLEISTFMKQIVLSTRYLFLKEMAKSHLCPQKAITAIFTLWVHRKQRKWIGFQIQMCKTFHWAILW